jgi:hypothetical protein
MTQQVNQEEVTSQTPTGTSVTKQKTEAQLAQEVRKELLNFFLKRLKTRKREDYPKDKELHEIIETLKAMSAFSNIRVKTEEEASDVATGYSDSVDSLPFPVVPKHSQDDLDRASNQGETLP